MSILCPFSSFNLEFKDAVINRLQVTVTANLAIEVAPSWIPEANQGLFAKRNIMRGQVVTCYVGELLSTKDAIRREDKSYLMRIGQELYIDSMRSHMCLARYINDCKNAAGYNVFFLKSKIERCAWVISLRDIRKGEELFVDYGRWYWLGPTKGQQLSFFKLSKLKNCLIDAAEKESDIV